MSAGSYGSAASVLIALACSACVPPVTITEIDNDRYELRADYDFFNPETGASDTLNRRSLALCNGRYTALGQSAEGTGTNGVLIWRVRCEGGAGVGR